MVNSRILYDVIDYFPITDLDYDGVSPTLTYDLVIQVDDGSLSVDIPVTVSVNPINEATPTFVPANEIFTETEGLSIGSLIGTFTATDEDSEPHNINEYEIRSGITDMYIYYSLF